MKRNVIITVLVILFLTVAAGLYKFYSKESPSKTPPPKMVYKNIYELDEDVKRLEALRSAKGLSWQEAYRLGTLYMRKERVNEAITELESSARMYADYPKTYESLGMAYFKTGKIYKAIELWEKALKMDPKAENLKEMISQGKGRMSLLDRISVLEKEIKPGDANWEKRFELSILYLSVNRIDEAKAGLEEVLKVKKDSPDVYDAMAEANAQSGDFEKAIESEKKALSLNPKSDVLKKRLSDMEKARDAGNKKESQKGDKR